MHTLIQKKILVTGAYGFLGRHLLENFYTKRRAPERNIFAPRKEEFDLRKKEHAEKVVRGIDIVIHLASVTAGIDFHRSHPGEIFYDNLMMGAHLMEAARQSGVKKFVTIGSVMEYPSHAPVPFKEENLWDSMPEDIHVPYAIAKKMLLVQGEAYRQEYGFNSIHLLLTNMFGPGDKRDSAFVIPSLIRRVLEAQEKNIPYIEVWGSGGATRDFLYVEDAAEGIVRATELYDSGGPVNMGSGIEVSIKELAEKICFLMGYEGEIRWNNSMPEGQSRRVLDISKAQKEFGFIPTTDFETGLLRTIEYIRKEQQ